MKDYERWFEEKGITDPKDQQVVLDYMRRLFEIAIEAVMKENNQPDQNCHQVRFSSRYGDNTRQSRTGK